MAFVITKDPGSLLSLSATCPLARKAISTQAPTNLAWIADVLRTFGRLAATDLTGADDIEPLIRKPVSIHTEMVFSRVMAGHQLHRQGQVFADLVGQVRPIVTTQLHGLTVTPCEKLTVSQKPAARLEIRH